MQWNSRSTGRPHNKGSLDQMIAPDVRPDLLRLKAQLGAFASKLTDLAYGLQVINKAVFDAQEIVEYLLEHELVDASHVVASDQSIGKDRHSEPNC